MMRARVCEVQWQSQGVGCDQHLSRKYPRQAYTHPTTCAHCVAGGVGPEVGELGSHAIALDLVSDALQRGSELAGVVTAQAQGHDGWSYQDEARHTLQQHQSRSKMTYVLTGQSRRLTTGQARVVRRVEALQLSLQATATYGTTPPSRFLCGHLLGAQWTVRLDWC